MPCDSSHLEPTGREEELRRAARLYCYVAKWMDLRPTAAIRHAAKDVYAQDKDGQEVDCTAELCRLLTEMPVWQRERVVYDAHDRTARDLADWWEDHQKADRAKRRKRVRERA